MKHRLDDPTDRIVQVINQTMYIVGETKQFPTFQKDMKLLLADVWAMYKGRLPDVDLVIQFDDWMPPNLNGECSSNLMPPNG